LRRLLDELRARRAGPFAQSTPRDGQWQRSYLALQREAKALLGL